MYSFELRPNSSLTPRAAVWFYGSLVALLLVIAVGCAMAGFWPVLPFAGVEVMVLCGAVAWVLRRAETREFIAVNDCSVIVAKRVRNRRGQTSLREYAFQRAWMKIELKAGQTAHWPSQLLFRSRGVCVEVGAFLTDAERRGLRERLVELLSGYGKDINA